MNNEVYTLALAWIKARHAHDACMHAWTYDYGRPIGSDRHDEERRRSPAASRHVTLRHASIDHACMMHVSGCCMQGSSAGSTRHVHPFKTHGNGTRNVQAMAEQLPACDRSACLACFVNPPGLSLVRFSSRAPDYCLNVAKQHNTRGRIYTLQGPSCLD